VIEDLCMVYASSLYLRAFSCVTSMYMYLLPFSPLSPFLPPPPFPSLVPSFLPFSPPSPFFLPLLFPHLFLPFFSSLTHSSLSFSFPPLSLIPLLPLFPHSFLPVFPPSLVPLSLTPPSLSPHSFLVHLLRAVAVYFIDKVCVVDIIQLCTSC